ncbi:HD domain-containing protein [bacterium]|nr:HD domain-containing protein [bacterium]
MAKTVVDYKERIVSVISLLTDKDAMSAIEALKKLSDSLKKESENSFNSEIMSLTGFANYLADKNNFQSALETINEGRVLAEASDNVSAKMLNEFILGEINFGESETKVALKHYAKANELLSDKDVIYDISAPIAIRISQIHNGLDFNHPVKADPLVALVKIGRSISALTDIKVLLKVIAEETRNAVQADRCTVFLWDKKTNELWSMVALGLDSEEIRFPADKGLAGYVAQTGESINIKDAYNDKRFNPEVDKKTGYKTKTILCLPIKNNNKEIIGVFQVLNKNKGYFTKSDEDLLSAIGGSASIALENAQLFAEQQKLYKEQKELFENFIDTLATSIDARDKITAGHSLRVKLYSVLLAKALKLDEKEVGLIEKAAILHDIGKIGIMDSVLQKEGKLTPEEYAHIQEHARITHDILNKIQTSEDFRKITEIASAHHEKFNGNGYYQHLKGKEIPLGGRILAVADVFDAITSKRHYRDRMPIKNALEILIKDSGTHFDSLIVDTFMKLNLYDIIQVFLTENAGSYIDVSDLKILSENTPAILYKALCSEKPTPKQKKLMETFDGYYTKKSGEDKA